MNYTAEALAVTLGLGLTAVQNHLILGLERSGLEVSGLGLRAVKTIFGGLNLVLGLEMSYLGIVVPGLDLRM